MTRSESARQRPGSAAGLGEGRGGEGRRGGAAQPVPGPHAPAALGTTEANAHLWERPHDASRNKVLQHSGFSAK